PGCPDFACSTASIARARMAFAMRSWSARDIAGLPAAAKRGATAAVAAKMGFGLVMKLIAAAPTGVAAPQGDWARRLVAPETPESIARHCSGRRHAQAEKTSGRRSPHR